MQQHKHHLATRVSYGCLQYRADPPLITRPWLLRVNAALSVIVSSTRFLSEASERLITTCCTKSVNGTQPALVTSWYSYKKLFARFLAHPTGS